MGVGCKSCHDVDPTTESMMLDLLWVNGIQESLERFHHAQKAPSSTATLALMILLPGGIRFVDSLRLPET